MELGAALRANRISAFLSIKYWSTGAIFEYLSDCAAACGTRKPRLITRAKIIVAMIRIILLLELPLWLSLVLFPRGGPHREVSFRRRCELSFIISVKSATGRISIGPSPYLKPGSCETS